MAETHYEPGFNFEMESWPEPDPEPEVVPVPFVLPSMVPPLVDVTCSNVLYRWFRCVPSMSDLAIEECGESTVLGAEEPSWSRDMEWDATEVLGISWRGVAPWALANGLSPGQPFLLRIVEPKFYGNYWDGDVDVEWAGSGLVRALPKSSIGAANAWDRALQYMSTYEDRYAARVAAHLALCVRSHRTWYVRTNQIGRYGEITNLSIVSTLRGFSGGVVGQGSGGSYDAAFRAAMADLKKNHPEANLDAAWQLGVPRNVLPSRWDLI